MDQSATAIDRAAHMFRAQSKHCADSNVPTYAAILDGCAAEVASAGPVRDILRHWDGAAESNFALRVLGALHRLALDGVTKDLAALFQTAGGVLAPALVWPVARAALAQHMDFVVGYTARPPQTNEVGRSAILLCGFLAIAEDFPHPFRLREVGASAGLNLMWDQYRITAAPLVWDTAQSPLELRMRWEGEAPPEIRPIMIADRAACDRDPIDIRNADDRARLESYIWPDQVPRMERLRKACAIALTTPFRLDRADAADWLEHELRDLPPGQTTVVYHSIFRQYLPPATDAKLQAVMDEAGGRATSAAPLAWLALEMTDGKPFPDLMLTTWPSGKTRKLATAHYHGDWIKWGGDKS